MAPRLPGKQRWDPDVLGNHRAVIEVETAAEAVRARVPWRRRDHGVATKGVVLFAEGAQRPIRNVVPIAVSREAGTFVFQPAQGPGTYFLYTMPYTGDPQAHYPKLAYARAEDSADPAWTAKHGLDDARGADLAVFPAARFVRVESVDDHNAFSKMEFPATGDEVRRLLEQHPSEPFLLFAADRTTPIRMRHDIPAHWAAGEAAAFGGEARCGEFYVYVKRL